jgi:hypothetical protein
MCLLQKTAFQSGKDPPRHLTEVTPAFLFVGRAGKEYKAEVGLLTRGILFTSDATSTATGIGESYV